LTSITAERMVMLVDQASVDSTPFSRPDQAG